MKKEVYFDNKKIVEISHKSLPMGYGNRKKNSKIYIFEDGSYIKSQDTCGQKFKYICSECGNEFFSKTKPEYGNDVYICRKCLSTNHNGMKGKHHTEEYKQRKSKQMLGRYDGENNPMYGKSWKDFTTKEVIVEHNKKLSIANSGENNPMYGKSVKEFMSEEKYLLWKQHISDGYWNKPEEERKQVYQTAHNSLMVLKNESPEYYREIKSRGGKSAMSKSQNYEKSSLEIIVENWLKNNNINYEYSPIMGSYQYDFIIHNKRILIEVQGDYWHGNPNLFNDDGSNGKRILNDIQKTKIEKDRQKLEFAKTHNFELICIWEEEINKGDFSKLEKIL